LHDININKIIFIFYYGGEKRRGKKNQKSQEVLPKLSLKVGRGHPAKAG